MNVHKYLKTILQYFTNSEFFACYSIIFHTSTLSYEIIFRRNVINSFYRHNLYYNIAFTDKCETKILVFT